MATITPPTPAPPAVAYERLVELLAAGDDFDAPLVEAITTEAGKSLLALAADVAARVTRSEQ